MSMMTSRNGETRIEDVQNRYLVLMHQTIRECHAIIIESRIVVGLSARSIRRIIRLATALETGTIGRIFTIGYTSWHMRMHKSTQDAA
jgi:hypothetical protein